MTSISLTSIKNQAGDTVFEFDAATNTINVAHDMLFIDNGGVIDPGSPGDGFKKSVRVDQIKNVAGDVILEIDDNSITLGSGVTFGGVGGGGSGDSPFDEDGDELVTLKNGKDLALDKIKSTAGDDMLLFDAATMTVTLGAGVNMNLAPATTTATTSIFVENQKPASDNSWSSVTYGNGLFVAVANSGTGDRVMTSPNGVIWTSRTSAANNSWSSVTYGNGLFVAVAGTGTGNRVMTSPDGVTWTSKTSAANNSWSSVTYGNGLFVAVAYTGVGNRVMTSPDGITWTSQTSAADNSWNSVCYGNGLFVAVAGTGTGNRVMTSPDGVTWTSQTSAADNSWNSICYGNGLFVAVAGSGGVMTSPDGVTWTSQTSATVANDYWKSIAYGNGMFVAISSVGVNASIITSPDAITWTPQRSYHNNWSSVVYGSDGLFIAVTINYVMTLKFEHFIEDNGMVSIIMSDKQPTDGAKDTIYLSKVDDCLYRLDDTKYTPVSIPNKFKRSHISWKGVAAMSDGAWSSICYGNGLFVAVASSGTGGRVMTSPDGITWTSQTSAANNSWNSICYGNGLFVAVANSGTGNRVMTSPDGVTWTSQTSAADNSWSSVTYGNGLFVAVASSGTGNRVMTSPDGVTWTSQTSAADNSWNSICYGNGLFVAVASSGVMTSPDGVTWTIRTSAADNSWWKSVTYGNGMFMAVSNSGTGNRAMTSPNGINWFIQSSASDSAWNSVCYGNGKFVATGTGNGFSNSHRAMTLDLNGQPSVMANVVGGVVNVDSLPPNGEPGFIYVSKSDNRLYYWVDNKFTTLTSSIANNLLGTNNINAGTGSLSKVTNITNDNIAFGYGAGSNITTGTQNVAIGAGSGPTAASLSNTVCIGSGATAATENTIKLGNSYISSLQCQVTTITAPSDIRDKIDVSNITLEALPIIEQVDVVEYRFDNRDRYAKGVTPDGSKADANFTYGIKAQQMRDLVPGSVTVGQNANGDEQLLYDPNRLNYILIKAVQELSARLAVLEERH